MSDVARKELSMAFCPKCGTFLQKAAIAQSEQICPCCKTNLVVSIKNGKVSVFESRREEDKNPEYTALTGRVTMYYNGMAKAR